MRARPILLLALTLLALLPLLSITTEQPLVATAQSSSTATFATYLNFTVPVQLQPGDALAPHLYDWSFDGVDDYVGVPNTRTLLYGATELTMASWVKHSAVPSGWRNVVSKGSSPLCIQHSSGGEYFEFAIQTSTGRTYVWSTTRTDLNVGKWFHVVAVWKSPTMYLYVNGALESTGTRDGVFVDTTYDFNIGRASEGSRYFPGFISTALIYSRALSAVEVQQVYSNSVVNASGLVLFLDATFYNGTHYIDISGNGNHGIPYNGVQRVPAERTWLWVIKGASTIPFLWLRFFPSGTIVVFSDGSRFVIEGPVNSVGLVESFAFNRTDIAYLLVPAPGTARSAALAVSPAYAYVQSRIEIAASWLSGVSNVTIAFPNGTLTWANGTGAFTTGPVLAASVRAAPGSWINITYVPLPGFTGGTAELTICTASERLVTYFNVTYVPGYSLDLSAQPRTTVGTVPWYSVSTNYTGTVELHNLNAYLNLTPSAPLQPGDTLAPHLYDWNFSGLPGTYLSVPSFTFPQVFTVAFSVKAYPKYSVHNSYEVAFGHSGLRDGTASLTLEDTLFGIFRVFDATGIEYALSYDPLYDEGAFTQVVAQYDGARMRLYKNGALVKEQSAPSTLRYPANELRLFAHGDGAQHNNMVASFFLVHSRALASEEVQQMYSSNVAPGNLAIFLDATFYNGTHYIDISGRGNHGIPYNGVQRVPAERAWLWVVKGLTSDPVVWLRFFPSGTIVVFTDGSATVVSGPVNAAGLVEEFAVGRTDIIYVLVPHPSRWSERSVLTRGTAGVLGFVAWMNVSAVYPLRTATVVYDKLLISWFSTSVPNATRIDAFRTSVDVCVGLVHAYDGQPVTGGAVVIAGRQAVFNGTCWTTSIPPPGSPVGSRNYTVVSSATSNLNVSFVDPSPVLTYVHDALVARVVSVDYINQTAVLELRYASDGSPVPSGGIGVLYGNTALTAVVSNGAAVFDLALLPVNVTSAPVVYGVSDNGYVSTPYVNASLPFHRLQGDWWSTRSPNPWFTVSTMVLNGTRTLVIRSNATTYTWLPVEPGYVYATGGYTLIRGSAYVVASGDAVIVLDMEPTAAYAAPGVAPGTGDAYVGVSSNLTHPLSGSYVLYVRVNSTGVYAGARLNGAVAAEEPVVSGALPPMVVSYAYSYDHIENTTRWCTMLVYYRVASSNYTSRCISIPGAPPMNLHPFIASENGVVVDRFAVTAGQSIFYLATGDIRLEIQGPYPATAIVRYVVVDKPTTIELGYGAIRIYQGGGRGITFKGFAGYKLNLAVGGITVSNYLIPSDNHVLELPLGFAAYIIIDPTYNTINIVSAGLVQEPVELTYGAQASPVALPSPGAIVDIQLQQPSVVTILAVATASAVGVSVFRSTRRLSASLSVAGATVSFIGVVLGASGIAPASVAVSLIASGVMAGAVALAIAVSKE